MSTTVVHLLRHGEVENPAGVMYGRLPGYHLSAAGRQMAERAAKALLDRDIVDLAASPLDRARQTAAPLAEALGLTVRIDERLIEAGNRFEGRAFGPGDKALWHPEVWPLLRNPFRPSWGEPYQEIVHRMLAAVHDARRRAEGHESVCVSHQLPIWALYRHLRGWRLWHDPRRRRCALASLTSLTFDGDRLQRIDYSTPAGPQPPAARPGA